MLKACAVSGQSRQSAMSTAKLINCFHTTKHLTNIFISAILRYSSKFINMNYRLKVYGVAGIVALIGIEMLNKLLDRATRCLDDVCVCKLRRGLKISFYSK